MSAPVLQSLTGFAKRILRSKERSLVRDLLDRFDVKPGFAQAKFSTMSGGNQQKALIGRWMASPPKVLLLDEPTNGVDIGAVDSILEVLRNYAIAGGSVIFSSTQYEDLARIADRVLVFGSGKVMYELVGNDLTPHKLLTSSYDAAGTGTHATACGGPEG